MKTVCRTAVLVLLASMMLSTSALATQDIMSGWAEEEVARAAACAILPEEVFEGDLTRPITRAEFAWLAVHFLTVQYNMDLHDMLDKYFEKAEIKPHYEVFPDFVDGADYNGYICYARALGIVSGYDDGTFKPDKGISRQEAALLLTNTFNIYGMVIIQEKGYSFNEVFTDSDAVAGWAIEAAQFMYQCDIMNGIAPDVFSPNGTYTVEQSIITFLHLYERAPESRFHNNLSHFMSYEEMLAEAVENPYSFLTLIIHERYDVELDDDNYYTIVYSELGGIPHGSAFKLWILYTDLWGRARGRREILQYLPQNPGGLMNDVAIQNLALNDDGLAITFERARLDYNTGEYEIRFYSVDLKTAALNEISP